MEPLLIVLLVVSVSVIVSVWIEKRQIRQLREDIKKLKKEMEYSNNDL